MAGEPPFYTEIDGKMHTLIADDVTSCGLRLPFGSTWQREQPAKLHCGADDPVVKAQRGEFPEDVPAEKTTAEAAAIEATKDIAPSSTAKATKAK